MVINIQYIQTMQPVRVVQEHPLIVHLDLQLVLECYQEGFSIMAVAVVGKVVHKHQAQTQVVED
jgi:hypothetical protein